jgi:hypothetical protein
VLTPPPLTSESPKPARTVRSRCVFYLSGFDPMGASRYHALYRDEALKQSRVSGVQMAVGPRQKTPQGNAFWKVTAQTREGEVVTHFEFLRWDDIVRRHWPKNLAGLLLDVIASSWLYVRTGTAWRTLKLSWPPVMAMLSATLVLYGLLVGTPLLAALAFGFILPARGPWIALAASGIACALWVQCGRMLEKKYSLLWLLRSYIFTAKQAQGRVPQLDTRLDLHASAVLRRVEAAWDDEVLIVGHSSGAMMAASVLAKVLMQLPARGSEGNVGPVVSLLTLGQCIPMLACLPQARPFRDDLQVLGRSQGFDWLDFTAPPDGSCFALVDPLAACGLSDVARLPDRPKLLSPKFADMFDAAGYRTLRRDKFRIHFQYLMASDKPVAYDYFAMTSGSMTLAGRFSSFQSVQGYTRFQMFPR